VQVTSIEPQISKDGDVVIRLRVSGDRDRAVQLVRNLERSRRFLQPRLTGETVQAKEQGQTNLPANGMPAGVEFEILANYNPLPEGESYPRAKSVDETAEVSPKPAFKPGKNDGIVLKPFSATHPQGVQRNGGTR
jgi:type IV pilus assembly protein PilN